MTISTADIRDVPAALALLFGAKVDAGVTTTAHAFQMLARGEWRLDDLFVAKSGDAIVGAVFAQRLPGSTGVIWPARTVDGAGRIEDELTVAALRHVWSAKVVQAFLKPDELHLGEPLLRAGFQRITQVLEMTKSSSDVNVQGTSRDLELVLYSEASPEMFQSTLWKSHENSLDCPEMHGARTSEEVREGYLDCARDTTLWWLAMREDVPVGVLIMTERELTFVGVVPEHRGKGIGRTLVAAACKNSPELSLIVDARNAPAIQLYRSMAFELSGVREVFLKIADK